MMASDKQKRGNWLKVALSLLCLKEGISKELNFQARQCHDHIKQLVAAQCKTAVTGPTCTDCSIKSIKRSKKPTSNGTNWYINCKNNVCNHWLDKFIQFHEHKPGPNVEWSNCDPTLWISQPWEIAKVFQPFGCTQKGNAEDSDVASLLTLMLDCKFFNQFVANKNILREIKDCRNETMHSATLEVEDADMKHWLDLMITLLEDETRLGQLPDCKSAADKIKELRDRPIEISFDKEDENTALGFQIATLSEEVSNIHRQSDDIKRSLEDLAGKQEGSSEESKRNHKELITTVEQLKEQIKTLKKTLRDSDVSYDKKLSDLQDRLLPLVEQNTEGIRKLDDKLASVVRQVDKTTSAVEEVKSELSHVQEHVGSLQKDKDVIGDTQKHLVSLYNNKCQKVPLYPLKPEWRVHVESLFVTPNMVVQNPRGVDILHTSERFSRDGDEIKVNDIRSIFFSGETLFTDVVIAGEAGSGKSVLCEYLVHLWVKCHSTCDQIGDKDNFMDMFTFLFYISLREAKSGDVEAMISDQLNIKNVDVSKLLLENTSLVILDGLDEYMSSQTSIPKRQYSAKSTYITTSRPWKIELLRTELEHNVKRQISLTGFERKEQEQLITKVLDLLNKEKGRNKSINDFMKEVENQTLSKQLETPVLLMQMLGLWFAGESFGRSQCEIYSKTIDKQLQFAEKIKVISEDHDTQNLTAKTKKGDRNLPACFKDLGFCQKYKSLLLKLAKLANQQLFSKDRSVTLIFDHDQMQISGMSEIEMKLCLHLGLLTQFNVIGEITQRLKFVSFVHKSHQEFFAAIYLSETAQNSDLQRLFEGFSDLDRALEIEKVFTFVSGLNPKVSCKIAKAIMQHVNIDSRVQQYRKSGEYIRAPNEVLVKRIQGVILAGIEEGKKNKLDTPKLPLQDIWMRNDDRDFTPSRILASSKALDLSEVKSVFIRAPTDSLGKEIWRFLKPTLRKLYRLVLFDCDISVDRVKKIVRLKSKALQALGIYYTNVGDVDISRLKQKKLQQILAAPEKSLGLGSVVLTHEQMGFVCQHLAKHSFITELYLANLKCTEHGTREKCLNLDLSEWANISRLELTGIPLQSVVFCPEQLLVCAIDLPETVAADVTLILGQAYKLEELQCIGYKPSALVELEKTLPRLLNLRIIVIANTDLRGHEQLLFTSVLKKLERICMYKVTMTAEHLQLLLAALPTHEVLIQLGDNKNKPVTISMDNHDVLKQIRDNPDTDVKQNDVERTGSECKVKMFVFYTKKVKSDLRLIYSRT